MEGKKWWILGAIFLFVLTSPLLFFNNASMGCYQKRIDKYQESPSSKDWQFRLAWIYDATLRPEQAAESYEKFWTRYPDEPRRPLALEKHARLLEQLGKNTEAIEVWRTLAREHPQDERGSDAALHLQSRYNIWDY
ncbi:MAG: tetratricopeptide repeat protein [Planctomycetes bacterium]|nr:tetratricopeptide repeat protein [Planctomycetota bacterium]